MFKTILSKKRFSKHLYQKKLKKRTMKSKSQMKNTTLLQKLLAIQFGIEDARRQLFGIGIENVLGTLTKKGKVQNGGLTKFIPRTVLNVYQTTHFYNKN
jgi:hypothetical protein